MNPDAKPLLPIRGRRERAAVSVSAHELCRFEPFLENSDLPWLVRPAALGVDLPAWLRNNRAMVSDRLRQHGGLLFRGFDVGPADRFEACITAISDKLLEYEYRSTPRTRVAGRIYTSTEYPPSRSIPLHNEMSYARAWPLKIWFHALRVAARGGQTPLADSRKVFARLGPRLRDRFAARQVMYVRNYGHGVDLPWQEVFQTNDRREVERFCGRVGIEFEWKSDDRLTTRQVCQAAAVHPQTGEPVWFNQAHLFHISSLDEASRNLLLERFGEDELPRNACFGDGAPIETDALDKIRDAYDREKIVFGWEPGDVLLLDNMRVAHGRQPFEGERRVLAGMAEPYGAADACVEM